MKIQRRRRERSKAQEQRIAGETKGRCTAASGALSEKSDVVCDDFRVEAKRTDKKQITLKLNDINKIIFEAHGTGRVPVIHLEIQDRRFYLLPDYIALEMMELWRAKQ